MLRLKLISSSVWAWQAWPGREADKLAAQVMTYCTHKAPRADSSSLRNSIAKISLVPLLQNLSLVACAGLLLTLCLICEPFSSEVRSNLCLNRIYTNVDCMGRLNAGKSMNSLLCDLPLVDHTSLLKSLGKYI